MIDPSAPVLKGLPKVHKPNIPIRPLVNFVTAPTYRVAKKLDSILRSNIILENDHSIKNSLELIEKTRNLDIKTHYTMASFDVENLYTNVPVKFTLELVKRNLTDNSGLDSETISEIMKLLTIVCEQNYFYFNGKYYLQEEGLAMGSPLSSILSEIYLNHIENEHIFSDRNKWRDKIIFYKRYVDDTWAIVNCNARQLKLLQQYLNNISPKLKFTLEIEENSSINFLDLTIYKTGNKLTYNIYRKPTVTSHTIHASSYHPQQHKMSAYISMVDRLLKVPMSPENYEKERTTIKFIAMSNGYDINMVDKLISKRKKKNSQLDSTLANNIVRPNKKYVAVEYGHQLNSTLSKELQKDDVILAYRTSNNLAKVVTNKISGPVNKFERSGVYKMKCSSCEAEYTGQTGRKFKTRFSEHLPKPHLNSQTSKFAEHLIEYNHNIDNLETNMDIIHICKKGDHLSTLEELEIYRSFKHNSKAVLNSKLNFHSNILYDCYLKLSTSQTTSHQLGDKVQSGVG